MKSVKKKSKIQMAREIIANLRQGMALRREAEPPQDNSVVPTPQPPQPRVRFQHTRSMQTNRAW